jgi:hypothetical protein
MYNENFEIVSQLYILLYMTICYSCTVISPTCYYKIYINAGIYSRMQIQHHTFSGKMYRRAKKFCVNGGIMVILVLCRYIK